MITINKCYVIEDGKLTNRFWIEINIDFKLPVLWGKKRKAEQADNADTSYTPIVWLTSMMINPRPISGKNTKGYSSKS